jgi:hypothetical protein
LKLGKDLKIEDIYKNVDNQINNLFNINFSFRINERGTWVTTNECWNIKPVYGCKRKLRKQPTTFENIKIMDIDTNDDES